MQIVCNKFVRYIISNMDKLIKSSMDIADGGGRDMDDMLYIHIIGAANCSSILSRYGKIINLGDFCFSKRKLCKINFILR